jgi:UDP-N-acetylglucosamine 2-epimerase (non-hydrolysing)
LRKIFLGLKLKQGCIMKPLSVWAVFGTRPEAIKMLPLVLAMQEDPRYTPIICVTAQHREILDQVLSVFNQKPDIDLNVMAPRQTLASLTSKIVTLMDNVIMFPPDKVPRPDYILVHGDTTTTFASALSGYYQGVPVCHVEAGLRTWDMLSPFPEEGNRQLTRVLCDYHFAPTETAKQNILKEGVHPSRITVTGNTVIDALMWMRNELKNTPSKAGAMPDLIASLKQEYSGYVLVTGHRRENHGDGFVRICEALVQIATKHADKAIIFPVHPNPNVREPVEALLGGYKNIHLIEPQDYAPFVYLMDNAEVILTDSGGVQEEAPSLGKPVLVMRTVTERPEAVEAGTVKLVGTDVNKITSEIDKLLTDPDYYRSMSKQINPYGDGKACARILDSLSIHNQKLRG